MLGRRYVTSADRIGTGARNVMARNGLGMDQGIWLRFEIWEMATRTGTIVQIRLSALEIRMFF